MAGGSVPSKLEAFKFKTKENNPFLGSFFPSSIFVRNPASPERSGWQSLENKCLRASFGLLSHLGCYGEEAAFTVSRVTCCGGQQIPRLWCCNCQGSLGQQKEALTHFTALSLTKEGQSRTDSPFVLLLVHCRAHFSCKADLQISVKQRFPTTTIHTELLPWGGKCDGKESGVSIPIASTD